DLFIAADRMGGLKEECYQPIPAHVTVYDALYQEYQRLYTLFGQGENEVMKRLRALRDAPAA
ncbi:MAG TPA: hypothetical protein PKE45_03795, partial [Caldilineaceae bacterium]|nr:hypothetical protein [Caldilineaceae bacterium]